MPQVGVGHSERRTMLTQHPLLLTCVQLKCLKEIIRKEVKSKLHVCFLIMVLARLPKPILEILILRDPPVPCLGTSKDSPMSF